ncbi:ROK family protein [Streptomyces sp. ODS28]|uniref:ROK family protein n=1 Tax=Streptomyces sp. ODS28 TaxID=3136688 RepID=UPI0031E57C94
MRRTSRDIRTANRYRLLRQVIAEAPVARPRLAAATGLSQATVATLASELCALGLLTESGSEESAGGRPRALLSPDRRGGVLVGVDVAETYVHAQVYDLTFAVLAEAAETLHPGEPGSRDPEAVTELLAATVHAAVDKAGAPQDRVLGTGVSMPGVLDRARGVSLHAANWGWHDVPLLDLLSRRLSHPLWLDGPLGAAALAELWFGAARDREHAVVVNLGTGVGAGLVVGGEVHRGRDGSAGEWGHTPLVPGGRPCSCGNHGCLEAYAGAPGILRTLREVAPDSPLAHPGDQSATIAALGSALAAETPVPEAAEVLRRTAHALGTALSGLVNLLNPEVVVLGSWVAAELGRPLLDSVRAVVEEHALRHPLSGTEFALCGLSASPVALGAAALALEGHLASPRTLHATPRTP